MQSERLPMNGWIKLHKKIIEWEWYTDANTFRVFMHCLLRANHKEAKWKGIDIPVGAFISSPDKIAVELGLTRQKVRTSLSKLTSELTIKPTNKYSLIIVNNYKDYQQELTSNLTNNQPSNNHQITTEEEEKEEQKEKEYKDIYTRKQEWKEKVNEVYQEKGGINYLSIEDIREFFDYWVEHGENDKKMRFEKETSFCIKRRLSTWKKNLNRFNPQPQNQQPHLTPEEIAEKEAIEAEIKAIQEKLNYG